ncbi:hypothetical protein BC567DRAFT_42268 [Phyllosticta citribraziliensis]
MTDGDLQVRHRATHELVQRASGLVQNFKDAILVLESHSTESAKEVCHLLDSHTSIKSSRSDRARIVEIQSQVTNRSQHKSDMLSLQATREAYEQATRELDTIQNQITKSRTVFRTISKLQDSISGPKDQIQEHLTSAQEKLRTMNQELQRLVVYANTYSLTD